MKKISQIIILVIIGYVDCLGQVQTSFTTTQRYWWYRYRLVNDFMKIRELEKAYIIQ